MNMPRRSIALVVGILISSGLLMAADPASQPAAQLPGRLAKLADVADRCEQYQRLATGTAWRTVYTADLSGKAKPTWGQVDAPQDFPGRPKQAEPFRLVKDDGESVLLFESPNGAGLLKFGPKITGDFVIEIVGKAVSDQPCDISIALDKNDAGPGFQFGANYNTRNKLWIGPSKVAADAQPNAQPNPQPNRQPNVLPVAAGEEQFVELGNDVLIAKNTWHRVRLEVREGVASGFVDGRLLGKSKLADGFDPRQERQPMAYVYSSSLELKEMKVEARAPDAAKADPAGAWKKSYGELTPREVRRQIDRVVECLGDEDYAVRDGAQSLLRRIGAQSIPSLEAAIADGEPETQARAKELMKAIRPPDKQPTKPARPEAEPDPVPGAVPGADPEPMPIVPFAPN